MSIYNIAKITLNILLILAIPASVLCAPVAKSKVSKNPPVSSPEEQKGMRYVSPLDQNALEREFKGLMAGEGFTYRKDKDIRSGKSRRLSFEKDNLSIDVMLYSLGSRGTEVVMTRYLGSEVVLDAKDIDSSLKNPSVQLPSYKKESQARAVSYNPQQGRELETVDSTMDLPVPPGSELLKEKVPEPLMGVGGLGKVYQSDTRAPKDIENFYRLNLKRLGFKENQERAYNVMNFKRLRFESSNMALELYLSPRGEEGSRFILVKYMDKGGVSKIEANPLYMHKQPKNDNANGADLANVPRPPKSVRQSGGTAENSESVSYVTPMNVLELRNFYRQEMPNFGWELSNEVSIRKDDEEYAKKHKGVGFVPSVPIGTQLDLGDIIRDSYILEFKSNGVTAQIMIYPDFTNLAAGAIVDISYIYPKSQERR